MGRSDEGQQGQAEQREEVAFVGVVSGPHTGQHHMRLAREVGTRCEPPKPV